MTGANVQIPLKFFAQDKEEESWDKLRENDAVNDMDVAIAGFDIHSDDVRCAVVRVGQNTATL